MHFHYRYRFQGESREMALGAWPRNPLDAIRSNFEETKQRVGRGGDPTAQKRAVGCRHQRQDAREQERTERRLTVAAMFKAWHPRQWRRPRLSVQRLQMKNRPSRGVARAHTAVRIARPDSKMALCRARNVSLCRWITMARRPAILHWCWRACATSSI
ncbi:integrase arm-type DNA-binding domain-containing protein [Paraburkholderia hiiakae]|uniref:integrase arm-type DNA-binding domain-containing protein n=1 Tax=Paraburkholderia hiiakae TaxID=1081782 RepID=UPI0038B29D29